MGIATTEDIAIDRAFSTELTILQNEGHRDYPETRDWLENEIRDNHPSDYSAIKNRIGEYGDRVNYLL